MTYKELKNRLNKCEYALKAIKDGTHKDISTIDVQKTTNQLNMIKESLQTQIKQLKEGNSKTYLVTPKKGQTTAVSLGDDEKDALKDADDVKAIKGIDGEEIKEGIEFTSDETKAIAKKVGQAVAKALKDSGDDVAHMKATNIEPNSFEIYVEYKNNSDDSFAFHLSKNKLHLADFSFTKALVDVSVKPSGEPIIHVDVLANELVKHFKSLSEKVDSKDTPELKKLSKALKGSSQAHLDQKKKLDKLINTEGEVSEDPYQTTYIKVGRRDYKKAMSILDGNLDPTYVKMDIVDDDGDGNVIIYFNFRASDDGEPGENVEAFIYDAASDLQAQGIHVTGSSHDIDEGMDINDPVLMKMRAAKNRAAQAKHPDSKFAVGKQNNIERSAKIKDLEAKRAQVMRDMEQEAEPEGGPIADKYGSTLNKIDQVLLKLRGTKNTDYDTAVGKVDETAIDPAEYGDIGAAYLAGFNKPHSLDLDQLEMLGRKIVKQLYKGDFSAAKAKHLKEDEEEDAKNDADYEAGWHDDPRQDEDADVGHQDDEPSMLSATARETAEYSAKLLKKLQAYDQHDGEVDFPNWWQSKLILAREYMSSAFHYLDSEEKQPALDQLALEHKVNEGRGDMDTIINLISDKAAESGFSEAEEAEEVIEAIQGHYNLDMYSKVKGVEENADYKYLTQVILDANPKMNVHYSSSSNAVNIGGVGYDKGDLVKNFNQPQGSSGKIKNNFYYANKDPQVTKREVEKLSNGKIKVDIQKGYGNEPFVVYSLKEGEDTKDINEYASRDFDEIFGALGYRQGFDEFIEDNPGCVEAIMEWIASIPDFQQKLSDEYSKEELENMGFYHFDDDMDEGLNKTKKAHDRVVSIMKDLAKKYREGDKSVVDQLKSLTASKKKLEAMLDKDVAGTGTDQELTTEGTDLYDRNGIQITRFSGGKKGLMLQINFGGKYIHIPANEYFDFIRAMASVKDDVKDIQIQKPLDEKEIKEAGPGFAHDCAAKVVHETYGKGNCIPEKHTLVKEGKKYIVTHYDVLFENGKTVQDIPVSELDIKSTNEHWHKGYKKKKK